MPKSNSLTSLKQLAERLASGDLKALREFEQLGAVFRRKMESERGQKELHAWLLELQDGADTVDAILEMVKGPGWERYNKQLVERAQNALLANINPNISEKERLMNCAEFRSCITPIIVALTDANPGSAYEIVIRLVNDAISGRYLRRMTDDSRS